MKHCPRATPLFLILLLTLTACRQDSILSIDQMAEVLFDIYRFDATIVQVNSYINDTDKARYYNGIFAKHHTDKAEFDRSLEWYARHPEQWRLVHKKLETKGQDFLDQINSGQLPELKARGIELSNIDTLDYWLSMPNMYWYRDGNEEIDSSRIHQELKGRKYFIGAQKIELTFRMRCASQDSVTVHTNMIINCLNNKKSDTIHVQAPADNRWHIYHLATGKGKKGITDVIVTIADSTAVNLLSSIEYEDMRLMYIYVRDGEHIDEADQRILNRMQSNKRIRQYQFNDKRDGNGQKNSSQLDKYPELPVK